MTTGPGPTHPDGPTGPGRVDDFDAMLNRHHLDIGEPNEFSTPPLPRLGEAIRDLERLIRCCLAVLDRKLDPASLPTGTHGHLADALLETTGYHLEAAMRDLGHIAALPLPAIGSAVKLPAATGKEPAPGSAAATPSAAREATGAVVASGAGADPDSSPGGGPPVSLSGRGVGPGLLAPTCGQGTPQGPCALPRFHHSALRHMARP